MKNNKDIELPLAYEQDPTLPPEWWKDFDWGTWRVCSIDGCELPYNGGGYCAYHYNRIIRKNQPADSGRHNNKIKHGDLTEDEFIRAWEFHNQNRTDKEIAYELEYHMSSIIGLWDYRSYSQYKRKDKPDLYMRELD